MIKPGEQIRVYYIIDVDELVDHINSCRELGMAFEVRTIQTSVATHAYDMKVYPMLQDLGK